MTMAITHEQIKEIRKQIINQIKDTFPEDKRAESISRIESMNDSEVMQFLEENNLIKDMNEKNESENCVFCSIANEKIHSIKINENENAVAVLEINPLSKGHTMVIPKEHSEKAQKKLESFVEETKKIIQNSLKPKEIVTEHSELFGHSIINLIPVYGDSIEKDRKKSSHEELEKIKEEILHSGSEEKKQSKIIEISKPKEIHERVILPKRIP